MRTRRPAYEKADISAGSHATATASRERVAIIESIRVVPAVPIVHRGQDVINKSNISYGTSPQAAGGRQKKARLRRTTGGKCFYCGCPTVHQGQVGDRDWLLLGIRYRMVQEHVLPTSRGGAHHKSNFVPACGGCNYIKGAFTIDEFRLLRGFQTGSLNFRFAFEAHATVSRDWLCCNSEAFERNLVVVNMPSAKHGYELRRRDPKGPLHSPRVRPIAQ